VQEVRQNRARGRAIDGNEAIPSATAEQRPTGQRDRFDAWQCAEMVGHLIPEDWRLIRLRDSI
jgi:hypothetical protein